MKKAALCIGNKLRGDDAVGIYVGELLQKQLPHWKIFFGEDVPENEFGFIRDFNPDLLLVIDAISGFKDDKIEFFDLSFEQDYIYSTHNLPTPILLSYLRSIVPQTLFLGICVHLENVLHFKEGLSKKAENLALKAIEKIKFLDSLKV